MPWLSTRTYLHTQPIVLTFRCYTVLGHNTTQANHGHKCVIMIGDGVTDMEARPPAEAFIGFGGNVVRQKVKEGADWFVTDFQELIDALQ